MTRILVGLLTVLWMSGCAPAGTGRGLSDSKAVESVDAAPSQDVGSALDTGVTAPPKDTADPQKTETTDVTSKPDVTATDTTGGDTLTPTPPDSAVTPPDVPTTDNKGCPLNGAWPARILLIGNSYAGYNGGLNNVLKSVMNAHPCAKTDVTIAKHSPGGQKIYQHYEQATTPDSNLHKLLNQAGGWDIVVLQDQSQIPGFPVQASPEKLKTLELMDDWAQLVEATGAQLVLFMTWGRRDGDPMNTLYPDFTAMQNLLAAGYTAYAKAAQKGAKKPVLVAPVGLAWQAVHDNALDPAVSDKETKARFESLYAGDGSHPSMRGTYAAAAVFLELLTQAPASLGAWAPDGITNDDKAWLDKAASKSLSP